MKGRMAWAGAIALLGILAAGAAYVVRAASWRVVGARAVGREPVLKPDYAGTIVPPNIAPLRFRVVEPGRRYVVRFSGAYGRPLCVRSADGRIRTPLGPWRTLAAANAGGRLLVDVAVLTPRGWEQFEPVTLRIAKEPVDRYLVYRQIGPVFNLSEYMSIRERDLQSFEDRIVIDNSRLGHACINCHTFCQSDEGRFAFEFRSNHRKLGAGLVVVSRGRAAKVDTRTAALPWNAGYLAWHPGGRWIAFSVDMVRQFFHQARLDMREGIDLAGNIGAYDIQSGAVSLPEALSRADRVQTWPTWSPDGRWLYYCSAPLTWSLDAPVPPPGYRDVRADLMRVAFDAGAGHWGKPEPVLSAEQVGGSISEPRVSPDGRLLLFCLSGYSVFPPLPVRLQCLPPVSGEQRPVGP